MTTPAIEGLLTVPYVSVAEFRASPTWMDTDDLIEGGTQAQQDAELYNVLLRASAWADNFCGGGTDRPFLKAHTVTENTRARIDRYGQIYLHPSDVPVRQLAGLAYGSDMQNLTVLSASTVQQQSWVEDGRGILVAVIPWRGSWAGTLEFGSVPAPGGEMFIQYSYVAGYAHTTLANAATQGASSITVTDPTGIQPQSTTLVGNLAGSTMRIWDPALEEAVSVGTNYTAGNATVPLSSGLVNAHAAGVSVSEIPAEVHQAVICYAVSLMLREDVSGQDPFGNTPFGPSAKTSKKSGKGAGLIEDAKCLLEPYRRVR